MRARERLVLCGALALGVGVGAVVLGRESFAVELPPAVADVEATVPPPAPTGPADAAPTADVGDGPLVAPIDAGLTSGRERTETAGWTHGIVRGDVELAVSVLDRIQSLSVVVEELRNGYQADGTFRHPYKQVVPVKVGTGTPTFEVRDIPFSEYPYSVSLYSPGLNGGRRTLNINRETPLVEDLVLQLTAGAPFSLLLRDQDANPYVNLDVRMLPVGEPAGRPRLQGHSDGFGSVVFESVLAGDYQIVVGRDGQPLGEPQTVTVLAGGRVYGGKVQGQGHVVTIHRGMPLQVLVSDVRGYGVADARVRLQATDKVKLTMLEGVTDHAGRAEFPYLTPGVWQIDVDKQDFQNRARQITVKDSVPLDPVQVQLVRLR